MKQPKEKVIEKKRETTEKSIEKKKKKKKALLTQQLHTPYVPALVPTISISILKGIVIEEKDITTQKSGLTLIDPKYSGKGILIEPQQMSKV